MCLPQARERSRRVHILGVGSIGKLVAFALRKSSNPPRVSLIFHKSDLLKEWEDARGTITLEDHDNVSQVSGFDMELDDCTRYGATKGASDKLASPTKQWKHQGSMRHEPIHNLIVATKTIDTVAALSKLAHRISPATAICFMQNGMGVIDQVTRDLLQPWTRRPTLLQGIVSHGVYTRPKEACAAPFSIVHAGHGTIFLGEVIPRQDVGSSIRAQTLLRCNAELALRQHPWFQTSSEYLLQTLARCPMLCVTVLTPKELLQRQLEKLLINAVLSPLTALLGVRTGAIFDRPDLLPLIRAILYEALTVIRSLPEAQVFGSTLCDKFNMARSESLVMQVAKTTKDSFSSMLGDVRAGRQTEVEHINGFIVRRGLESGVECTINAALVDAVNARLARSRQN